jgi:cytochrome P450
MPAMKQTEPSVWELRRLRRAPIAYLQELATGGDVVAFSLGGRPAFLLNHPLLIEDVLLTHSHKFEKSPALHRARRLLGNGLLTAENPLHGARRRLIQPAFHRHRMGGYGDAMVAHAARIRDRWHDGRAVDIGDEMSRLTLGIVGTTLFGADLEAHAPELRRIVANAIASFDPLVALVAPRRRVRLERERLEAIVGNLVDRHLQTDGSVDNLLSLLLAAREDKESPSAQLYDDAMTLLLAGFDTIANALTWTWTLLAAHPSHDETLHREVVSVTGSRLPTAADLPAFTYTRSVLAESLRLMPPAWVIARRALETHRVDSTDIPVGSLVLMSPYLVHRDPRFFAEPLTFNPGRWVDGHPGNRPKLAYFPFGAGSRSCIGEAFAWMEGVLVLAALAQRWRLRLHSGAGELDPRITLRPRAGVLMVPETRT